MNKLEIVSRTLAIALVSLVLNYPAALALSIKDYVDGALRSNPSAEAAMERVRSAEIGVESARLAYLPKVTLNYSYSVSNSYSGSLATATSVGSPVVSMSLALWDSGIRKYNTELAEAALKSSQIGALAARQALIVQTLKTYAAWDGQSSLEYTYHLLAKGITTLINGLKEENKLSDSGRKLLESKREELLAKQQSARSVADFLSIQVQGISGIVPTPYVGTTQEEYSSITKFYNDLLLDQPLPTAEESESFLLENNIAIQASQMGLESAKLSQLIGRAAALGPKVNLVGTLSSSRGSSETVAQGMTIDTPISQRGNSLGIVISIPLDAQAYKNTERNRYELSASNLSHNQLVKDLKTAVRSSRANVSILRIQVGQLRDSLTNGTKPYSLNSDYSDVSLAGFLAFLGTLEQKSVLLNGQAGILFSSTVDYISLIYNLETYLKGLKY